MVSVTMVLIAFFYLIFDKFIAVSKALGFVVVLLVASIPLAIEIITTTNLALSSTEMSAHGAIVTRLASIEDLACMSILCSDKTGTLTTNKMELQSDGPIYDPELLNDNGNVNIDIDANEEVLRYAAMATKWNDPPRDALDALILGSLSDTSKQLLTKTFVQLDYLPFDPVVKRTEGTVLRKNDGYVFKTSKGAREK